MGAQLVSRVYTSWTHLPDRPFRLLTYMALIAKDTNELPTYWGGRDALAEALGLKPGTDSSRRMVRQVIHVLIATGAIERTYVGHAGRRTEYQLTLTPRRRPKGDSGLPQKGDSGVPPQGDSGVPRRGTLEYPPRNHKEYRRNPGEVSEKPDLTKTPPAEAPTAGHLALVRARADAETAP